MERDIGIKGFQLIVLGEHYDILVCGRRTIQFNPDNCLTSFKITKAT